MATKKDIKAWLKETGLTEEKVDNLWGELVDINWKCRALDKEFGDKHWRGLRIDLIREIPTLKEKTEESIRKAEEEEEAKRIAEEKEKADREYYNEHFLEIMVGKIDNGEKLTEAEIRTFAQEYGNETTYGENMRWVRSASTVVPVGDRLFMVDWCEGLTECQENEFFEQPYEVERHETEKVITVVTYERVKRKKSKRQDAVSSLGEALTAFRDGE